MIKAKGKRNGKNQEVEYIDGVFLFDGKENALLETLFREELAERRPFGGTYCPQSDEDPFNIICVLEEYWFDKPVIAEADPEVVLPEEPGMVY